MSKDIVFQLINALRISDALTLGEILHAKGIDVSVHSARVQGQKALNSLVDLGKLDRGAGYYRTLDCKSEYADHARLLTIISNRAFQARRADYLPRTHNQGSS